MKIICYTIEDFLTNLKGGDFRVHRGVVHYNRTSRPMGNCSPKDATSFEVFYQVSAILQFEDGSDSLLEAGELCGIDRTTGDGGPEGTDRQKTLHATVLEFCLFKDLRPMPGVIDA